LTNAFSFEQRVRSRIEPIVAQRVHDQVVPLCDFARARDTLKLCEGSLQIASLQPGLRRDVVARCGA
jgi:hypothetical protein